MTLALADQPDALPLDQLTVIGLFSGPDGGRALLRAPSGDIAALTPGESAFGVTLDAVDESQAIVTDRRGQSFALTLPAG